jgi:hypothetical protein
MIRIDPVVRKHLQDGLVIPACPLALTAERRLEEKRQRALVRYYLAAGAGGIAAGVHTTQFTIREAGLFRPVLELISSEMREQDVARQRRTVRIGGICGQTKQALAEAGLLAELGFDAGLLSLGALRESSEVELLEHCRTIAGVLPLIGFYLQPAAGGRLLPYSFWRQFAEIENVIAIKIAPFNRYQTIDVVRAVVESGRTDIALYTGNDDNIVLDLITSFRFRLNGAPVERRIVGGLLGHWAVWTRQAVRLLDECHCIVKSEGLLPQELLQRAIQITDANAAFFDAANGFAGCIPGIHEVLRRQGLLAGTWCLDQTEQLSPGQSEEIDRVYAAYPDLNDDVFVAANLAEWLR